MRLLPNGRVVSPVITLDYPGPRSVPPPPGGRAHRVRRADTLASLGRRYYGHPEGGRRILHANREQLGPGGALVPGQVLSIPY